jgi:hypothetical protein
MKHQECGIETITMVVDYMYELIDQKLEKLSLQLIKNVVWIINLLIKKCYKQDLLND